jgi:hypothetical protein
MLGEVLEAQCDGLGDAKSRHRQQREQGRVRPGTQRTCRSEGGGFFKQLSDLIRRIEKGAIGRATSIEDPCRWNLMTRIFRLDVAAEDCHHLQAPSPLMRRWCQSGPFNGSAGTYMALVALCGEARVVAKQRFRYPQLEPGGPPDGKIGIDSIRQHGHTSGHGCANCRKRSTSTLA